MPKTTELIAGRLRGRIGQGPAAASRTGR